MINIEPTQLGSFSMPVTMSGTWNYSSPAQPAASQHQQAGPPFPYPQSHKSPPMQTHHRRQSALTRKAYHSFWYLQYPQQIGSRPARSSRINHLLRRVCLSVVVLIGGPSRRRIEILLRVLGISEVHFLHYGQLRCLRVRRKFETDFFDEQHNTQQDHWIGFEFKYQANKSIWLYVGFSFHSVDFNQHPAYFNWLSLNFKQCSINSDQLFVHANSLSVYYISCIKVPINLSHPFGILESGLGLSRSVDIATTIFHKDGFLH